MLYTEDSLLYTEDSFPVKAALFFGFTQRRMVVSYQHLGQYVCLCLSVPSSGVKQSKKKCFLLDIPEDLALMFSVIAVVVFFPLPQLLVDTKVGLCHCLFCKNCILRNLNTKSSHNLIYEFSCMLLLHSFACNTWILFL